MEPSIQEIARGLVAMPTGLGEAQEVEVMRSQIDRLKIAIEQAVNLTWPEGETDSQHLARVESLLRQAGGLDGPVPAEKEKPVLHERTCPLNSIVN